MFRTLLETKEEKGRKKVSYIQSRGAQYIDANLPFHNNGFRVDFAFSMEANYSNQYIWGAEDSSSYNKYYFKYTDSTSYSLGTYRDQYVYFPSTVGTRYEAVTSTIRYETQYVNIDGVQKYSTQNNKNFARTEFSPYIFALNSGGSPTGYSTVKLYYIRFYDESDNLLRDFEPSLDPDGVPCLYDKVNDRYYYNKGTGSFLYGSVIPN